jgi:HNH endonuclease/AP2 domain
MILDQKILRLLIDYDPTNGTFVWRNRHISFFKDQKQTASHNCAIWNSRFAGKPAGCVDSLGYLTIRINDVLYGAHRLAWVYMTGDWPPDEIDHIDCDRANNRWKNIRLAAHAENGRNLRKKKTNKSGFKGVHLHKQTGKWRARIQIDGRSIHLGLFNDPESAHEAYLDGAQKYHGRFSRAG